MPSERGKAARQIFEQALEVSGQARERFLRQACQGDAALMASVDRLLRADAAATDFLRSPLVQGKVIAPFLPPERIGPYKLQEKIGEGGMGVVYEAVRDDEAFHRKVAIKLIVRGIVSEEARRRLKLERQVLAVLDHPGIAEIFDGGTTEDGVPYLVMEYVDGKPIDRYCEHVGLTVRQRIELFRKICAAVHCSHQNLVVHCDLKPSNILITDTGEPKLLDFGIAKLLRRDMASDREAPTAVERRPLTPEYASPEQLRGKPLSTVSDVYSLGVLLYKLLTGRRPESLDGNSRESFEVKVVPPSATIRDLQPDLSRQLQGDLDAIVLKALRASPEERFGSTEQFSEDLGRYLNGFPVLARQGNLRYRAKKFLRRHRVPVAAAVTSIVVLVFFALSLATQAKNLTQERAKLQEVVSFFRLFFERAGPLVDQGRNLTLREAVDQNAAMIEEGLEEHPEVKVEIADVLGEIYLELGQVEEALAWSSRALVLHRELTGEKSSEYSLGQIRVAAALRDLGRYEEAEAQTRAGLEHLQAGAKVEASELVEGLNTLVLLLCYQERYQEADKDSATALALAKESLDAHSVEALVATSNRGLILRKLGETAEAQRFYEQAIDLYQVRLGGVHPHVATLWLNLSNIYRERGELTLARSALEKADHQYLRLFGSNHHTRVPPLVGLAKLAVQQKLTDEALTRYREAIGVAKASNTFPVYVLRSTLEFGELILASGRCAEGEPILRDTLEHSRPYADSSWRYGEIEGLLGECMARRKLEAEGHSFLLPREEHLPAIPAPG